MTNGTAVLGTQEQMLAKIKELEEKLSRSEAARVTDVQIALYMPGETMFQETVRNSRGVPTGEKRPALARVPMVEIKGRKNIFMSAWKFRRVIESGSALIADWTKVHGIETFDLPEVESE